MKIFLLLSLLSTFSLTASAQTPSAYVMEFFTNPGQFGTIPLSGPFYPIPNIIATNAFNMQGGDFDDSNNLYTFILIPPDYHLGIVDLNTGAVNNANDTPTIVSGVVAPQFLSQLSYNVSNDTFYALSHDPNNNTGTQVYSLNTSTGVLTPIGSGTGITNGVAFEIDNNGIAYAADANSGDFYTIDLETGIGTVVGNSMSGGFYPVGQGFSIDHTNNTMYAVLQNSSGIIRSHFYTVDLNSGALTDLGDGSSRKYSLFAISPLLLGVNELAASEINVYPNPSKGQLTIDLGKEYKDVTVQISNILGQVVLTHNYAYAKNIKTEINGSAGIYFVNIHTSEGEFNSAKIIKNR